MKHIFKTAASLLAAGLIASCTGNQFKVEGQIANAADSVLYFENVGLEGVQVLDSVKLSDGGGSIGSVSQTRLSTSASILRRRCR